jgi:hypothetical protein
VSRAARDGNVTAMSQASLLSMPRERAGLHPNGTAFTFTDYEQDWAGDTQRDALERLDIVKVEVASAISNSHDLNVADLVLVQPGSIPATIRCSACVEHYRGEQCTRLDA